MDTQPNCMHNKPPIRVCPGMKLNRGLLTALLSPSSVATMDFIVNAPKAERKVREDS